MDIRTPKYGYLLDIDVAERSRMDSCIDIHGDFSAFRTQAWISMAQLRIQLWISDVLLEETGVMSTTPCLYMQLPFHGEVWTAAWFTSG